MNQRAPTRNRTVCYIVVFDGGVDPNPGAGYGSYYFMHLPSGRTREHHFILEPEPITNNEAEWLTLIEALHAFRKVLGKRITGADLIITGDSRLVINQLSGEWDCHEERMAHLRDAALSLLDDVAGWRCEWRPRDHIVAVLGH